MPKENRANHLIEDPAVIKKPDEEKAEEMLLQEEARATS